jgi:hypothetical protein
MKLTSVCLSCRQGEIMCDQATRGCWCPYTCPGECDRPPLISAYLPLAQTGYFVPRAPSRSISLRRELRIPGLGFLASIASFSDPGTWTASVVDRTVGVGSRLVLDRLLEAGAGQNSRSGKWSPASSNQTQSPGERKIEPFFEVTALGGTPMSR